MVKTSGSVTPDLHVIISEDGEWWVLLPEHTHHPKLEVSNPEFAMFDF